MKCTLMLVGSLLLPAIVLAEAPEITITPDVVYGHKDGLALTFDMFVPRQNANGAGVLFMVSGGWYSHWTPPEQTRGLFKPLTDKGLTVFAVRHGSSPRYSIPEAVADVRRSVRFIRLNANQYQIDPNRLGVYGLSAGGHLSLMLGTTADEGNPNSQDPVERVSDRVQAVVAFVAPTDLTIMVKDAPQRLPAYAQFPALNLDMKSAEIHSPLKYVSSDDAPTLLLAGAKDGLVPIDHNRKIHQQFDADKVVNKLVEFENAGHGFQGKDLQRAVEELVAWFEMYLARKTPGH